MGFGTELAAAGVLLVGIVAVASLVNAFAKDHRWVVRRLVILYALYALTLGVSFVLDRTGLGWARAARVVAHAFATFTAINVVAAVVFDLGLPRLGLHPAKIVSDLVLGLAYALGTGAVLAASGFSLSSVLTTGAVFSAVLALSLQSTLGNVLGGVTLQLDGSFKVGDWVQLENGRQGVVREIRWRCTILETRDFDTIVLPNSQLMTSTFTVLGRRGGKSVPRRMKHLFNVDFRTPPTRVVSVVTDALLASPIPNVAADPPPSVWCVDLGRDMRQSFAVYEVRYFILDLGPDSRTSSSILSLVHASLRRAGIPLAMPVETHMLRLEGDEADARREERHKLRRRDALSTVTIFRTLEPEERAVLEGQLEYVPFTAGEKMTRQGAMAHWLYVMTSGEAEVRRTHEDGGTTTLGTIQAPDFFGEMGLMTGEPRIADVVAKTDVECFRLRKEGFEKVLLKRPEIAKELSSLLAERRMSLLSAAGDRTKTRGEEEERIFEAIGRFFGLKT